jgi:hypothetical protein
MVTKITNASEFEVVVVEQDYNKKNYLPTYRLEVKIWHQFNCN